MDVSFRTILAAEVILAAVGGKGYWSPLERPVQSTDPFPDGLPWESAVFVGADIGNTDRFSVRVGDAIHVLSGVTRLSVTPSSTYVFFVHDAVRIDRNN